MAEQVKKIGIRREDKSEWERRVPLIPEDVASLAADHALEFVVQPSPIRIFPDDDYRRAGAIVDEDLSGCDVIFAVKEVPDRLVIPGKTYMFFSHTIKGQSYNMDMLRTLMLGKCQLIDYERVVDDQNRRLIFFGRHAGLAGMTDTLWSLGQRLKAEGLANPFESMQPAHAYRDVDEIKEAVAQIGRRITADGLPESITPLVIGFAGYGNVSQGAQEIAGPLPIKEISPAEVAAGTIPNDPHVAYKVVFKEEDMVTPRSADDTFELQDYYQHPEKYRSRFESYLPHLSVLVNCIYWDTPYPRLITKQYLRDNYMSEQNPRLKVVGDISCDPEGSIEATLKATLPDNPVFVYNPKVDIGVDGFVGDGLLIMAVDILPSELPLMSSQHFSTILKKFVPQIAAADFSGAFDDCGLPDEIKRATILHRGAFTPDYEFMNKFI